MTDVDGTQMLANLHKKRGSVRGAITKLGTRIQDLEDYPERPNRFQAANLLLEKLEMNEKDFKRLQDEILEYIDQDHQEELNENLTLRLRVIINSQAVSENNEDVRADERRLKRLQSSLKEVKESLDDLVGKPET